MTPKRLAALAGVVVLAVTLTACTSSKPSKPTPTSSATTPTPGPGVTIPTKVPNQVSVRKYVTLDKCIAAPGGWSASGTIDNKLTKAATYEITVFFTSALATDLQYGVTKVQVDAGKKAPWTVTATFQAPSKVICVLRGVAAH